MKAYFVLSLKILHRCFVFCSQQKNCIFPERRTPDKDMSTVKHINCEWPFSFSWKITFAHIVDAVRDYTYANNLYRAGWRSMRLRKGHVRCVDWSSWSISLHLLGTSRLHTFIECLKVPKTNKLILSLVTRGVLSDADKEYLLHECAPRPGIKWNCNGL